MGIKAIGRRLGRLLTRSSRGRGPAEPKWPKAPASGARQDVYDWISTGISAFKEWYQPVDFGNGVIAHQTLPPDWKPDPSLLHDTGGGLAKWNHIVRKH